MNWNRAFNWVMAYVLRWTAGAAIFGMTLELILSQSSGLYRYEVPVYLTFLIFTLSLCGGIVALYFSWLLHRYRNS